jgi:hypothetical protein
MRPFGWTLHPVGSCRPTRGRHNVLTVSVILAGSLSVLRPGNRQDVARNRQDVAPNRQDVAPNRQDVTPNRQDVTPQHVTPNRQHVTPNRQDIPGIATHSTEE